MNRLDNDQTADSEFILLPDSDQINPGYINDQDALLKRMRRIEGQTRGIEKMIAENKYCIDILNQIAAARMALDKVAMHIVNEHINHCVREVFTAGKREEIDTKTQELMEVIDRFIKTR